MYGERWKEENKAMRGVEEMSNTSRLTGVVVVSFDVVQVVDGSVLRLQTTVTFVMKTG